MSQNPSAPLGPKAGDAKSQLRRVLGFWDVLLFNIGAVLGPRWIAAAAHNGTSSISLWVLAALFFFLPTTFVIVELSTRFPEEGGLYVWSKEAFGDFHGFIAGWTYWVYTFFYFPALLMASAAMAAYIGGGGTAYLAQDRTFLVAGSFGLLFVAVSLNIVGLNIGKWLQNVGAVSTYVPLLMLVGMAAYLWHAHGSVTHFTWQNIMPTWDWGTVNFWPQIAFAFVGLELCATMSEEVRNPQKTLPRAIFGSGILIALIYIAGTFAVLSDVAGGCGGSQERSISGADRGIDDAADCFVRRDCGDSGDSGKRGRRRRNGGGSGARAVRGGDRSLLAGSVWADSSEVEDAVGGDTGAGFCDGSRFDPGANQRQPEYARIRNWWTRGQYFILFRFYICMAR